MQDEYLPLIDLDFLISAIQKSEKCQEYLQFGKTHVFVKKGNAPMSKRIKFIPELYNRVVSYEYAVGIAVRFGFLEELMKWCADHKNFTDGGYTIRDLNKNPESKDNS